MTISTPELVPVSLLDTDLYKFTMQQAVLRTFPTAECTYRFVNRSPKQEFSKKCIDVFTTGVSRLSELTLTPSEYDWLKTTCPFFAQEYLDYLSQYRFKPEQVSIKFVPSNNNPTLGLLEMTVSGRWVETILWEVPLMSLLSEAYFLTVDHDWNYEGQEELAYRKGITLLQTGITFSEFGTRRRRSQRTHDLVVSGLKRASQDEQLRGNKSGKFVGTSNVYLAFKYNVRPSGTIAHEWFMAIGACLGYEHANAKALDLWHKVYGNYNLTALTDTFTTEAFFKDFTADHARLWSGLRQDSGDPFLYAPRAKAVYESLGVDPSEHFIVYSDGLSLDLAKRLKEQCDQVGMQAMFGIGTNFTNDYRTLSSDGNEKSKALNIVIKISSIDGKPCVKLSDEPNKHTGGEENIRKAKEALGLA